MLRTPERFALAFENKTATCLVCCPRRRLCTRTLSRRGIRRTQKFKTRLFRTQSSILLPLKPGAGPYIQPGLLHLRPGISSLLIFLPFLSIHLHFLSKPLPSFPVSAVANTGSFVGRQNKIGHPACCYRQLMQVPVLSARGIEVGSQNMYIMITIIIITDIYKAPFLSRAHNVLHTPTSTIHNAHETIASNHV